MAQEMGSMDIWNHTDRKIVLYPTSNNTLLNFVCIHPGVLSSTTDSYDNSASKKSLQEVFRDFPSRVLRLLNAPYFCVRSAGVLDETVTPAEIAERLQLYSRARSERASAIQEYSRQVGGDETDSSADANQFAAFKMHLYKNFGLSHDEVHHSTRLLRPHKWGKHTPVVKWRQPSVFGPLPGPRQDASGDSYTQTLRDSTKTSMSIQFKISATLLRNLFPNGRYYFEKKDTVAKASFSVETLQNMAWLGGGGYDLFALYVHEVCYKGADGRVRKGRYCPIMIENLADPILTGREELGIPKTFSDIKISKDAASRRAEISWRGAHWATLELKNLQSVETDPHPIDRGEGLLK